MDLRNSRTFPFVDSTTFDKMANAKVLEMEIGPYAFTFKPAGIQFLKDFSDAVKALPAVLASAGAVKAQAPDAAVSTSANRLSSLPLLRDNCLYQARLLAIVPSRQTPPRKRSSSIRI